MRRLHALHRCCAVAYPELWRQPEWVLLSIAMLKGKLVPLKTYLLLSMRSSITESIFLCACKGHLHLGGCSQWTVEVLCILSHSCFLALCLLWCWTMAPKFESPREKWRANQLAFSLVINGRSKCLDWSGKWRTWSVNLKVNLLNANVSSRSDESNVSSICSNKSNHAVLCTTLSSCQESYKGGAMTPFKALTFSARR